MRLLFLRFKKNPISTGMKNVLTNYKKVLEDKHKRVVCFFKYFAYFAEPFKLKVNIHDTLN